MIYKTQIKKKIQNIRVYEVLRKSGGRQNFLTSLFMRIINRNKSGEGAS